MLWVKGELLTELDAPGVDPTDQLSREAQPALFHRKQWFARVLASEPRAPMPLIARAASERSLAWLFLVRDGETARALSNWYSFAFRPVYAGEPSEPQQAAMLVAIARRLKAARPKLAKIVLTPVPEGDGSSETLQRAFRRSGWRVFAHQSSVSWTADVAGKRFDEYWAARPGQLRSTYKRKLAKAAFDSEIFTRFDEAAWADYEEIYADSWKPEEGDPAFLRALAEAEAEAGCLRLGICRVDGVPVAAQFWTVENGRALIHKLAHRESAHESSAGTILTHAMFRHAIDNDQVSTIDFGTGDDAYKADWMDRQTGIQTIMAFNPATASGLAGAAREWLSGLVGRARRD